MLPLMFQFAMAGFFAINPSAFSIFATSNFGAIFSLYVAIGFFVVIAWLSYETTQKLKVESSYLLRIIQVISVILVLHTVIWFIFLMVDYQNQGEISNGFGGLMNLELNNRIIRMGAFCIFELLISIYWFQTYSSSAIQEREQHEDMRRLVLEKDKLIQNLANSSTLIETGALSAGLAHELNQFLARIEINGDLALRRIRQPDSDGNDLEPSIQNILQANHAAAQLISSLKKLFISGKDESSLVDVDLLVRDTVSLYEKRLLKSQISIELSLQATEKVVLWDSLFRQLISNLISNAIDALEAITKENKKIVINTRMDHVGNYQITFSDNGPGISPTQQERIFDLFASTKKSGNGIGLWLCRYIVERHHGSIHCMNLPDCDGVVFTVSIPVNGLNT
jgi:signal transduction histidine kinase